MQNLVQSAQSLKKFIKKLITSVERSENGEKRKV